MEHHTHCPCYPDACCWCGRGFTDDEWTWWKRAMDAEVTWFKWTPEGGYPK